MIYLESRTGRCKSPGGKKNESNLATIRIIEKLKKQEGLRMNSSTFADATKQALERIEIDVLSVYRTLEQVTHPCVPSC
jgi:hypothetical protein